ncbi:MAG: DUF6438 domain-containing protein [Cyclobacteriaceae bacterium]
MAATFNIACSTAQSFKNKFWVNADHQSLRIVNEDSLIFYTDNRHNGYKFSASDGVLSVDTQKPWAFKISLRNDSLILDRINSEASSSDSKGVKSTINTGLLRRNLNDFEKLTFTESSGLVKQSEFEKLRLETTSCMGTCPVSSISLNKNGKLTFDGKENTKHLGLYETRLPKTDLKKICELVKKGDLKMLNDYMGTPNDFPSYKLFIEYKSQTSTYHGYYFNESLNQLIALFLEFDTTLNMKQAK